MSHFHFYLHVWLKIPAAFKNSHQNPPIFCSACITIGALAHICDVKFFFCFIYLFRLKKIIKYFSGMQHAKWKQNEIKIWNWIGCLWTKRKKIYDELAGRQAGSSLQMLNSFSLEMFVIFRVSSNETIAVGAQENTHTNLFLSAFFPSHSRGWFFLHCWGASINVCHFHCKWVIIFLHSFFGCCFCGCYYNFLICREMIVHRDLCCSWTIHEIYLYLVVSTHSRKAIFTKLVQLVDLSGSPYV